MSNRLEDPAAGQIRISISHLSGITIKGVIQMPRIESGRPLGSV